MTRPARPWDREVPRPGSTLAADVLDEPTLDRWSPLVGALVVAGAGRRGVGGVRAPAPRPVPADALIPWALAGVLGGVSLGWLVAVILVGTLGVAPNS